MTLQHALVQPSGLYLTMECAASLLLQVLAGPQPQTEETREGHAAHWHAVQFAQGNKIPLGGKFQHGGQEWEVDADMLHGSELWAYHCVKGATGRYEDPVSMPQIHEQCWGTPDYWNLRVDSETQQAIQLNVKDYKYGHRFVEVFECWQLIAYAIGVANRLQLTDPRLKVVLAIIQPRSYTREGQVREWVTTLGHIWSYVPRIVVRVMEALGPLPVAKTGPHCMDCDARHMCVTLQRGAMHIAEFAGRADSVGMDTDSLGAEARILLDASKTLEARLDGLKSQIEALIRSGKAVPYWGMEPNRSLLAWNEGVTLDTVRLLGVAAGGITTVNVPKPMTPTQCRDAGVDEAVINAYATRKPSGMTLKPSSTTKARKVFGANRQ